MHTLILDIGGIFFSPAWRDFGVHDTSLQLGIPDRIFCDALQNRERDFYEGYITERDYWASVLAAVGNTTWTVERLQTAYRSYITPVAEALSLLPSLSQQNVLVCCSNIPKEWMAACVAIAQLDQYFLEFFTSASVHTQKPTAELYERVFDYAVGWGLPIAYVDNNAEYINAARLLYPSVDFVLYQNPQTLLRWIV